MKKLLVVLGLCITGIISGQELSNFYLEPGSTANEATLHTSFYYSQGASIENADIEIVDNIINATLCYKLSSILQPTYDDQQFILNLPSGYTDFVLNVSLVIFDYDTGMCDLMNVVDSGTILIDFPYLPTEKTLVPDDSFEGFLESNGNGDDIPNNDEVFTHRIENITRLIMSGWILNSSYGLDDIEVLTGIAALTRLKVLHIDGNIIEDFDATNHPALTWLNARDNPLNSLDLSNNSELIRLWIREDNIEELDVSQNINLVHLWVNSSDLAILELGGAISLNRLQLEGTLLTELDISQNINLEELRCNNSLITSLDTTNNSSLRTLECSNNLLTSLILNNDLLVSISCSQSQLTSLDISSCPNLESLFSLNTPLTSLDIRDNPVLISIFLLGNNLTTLDLRNGNNENFDQLRVYGNPDLACVSVDDPSLAPYPYWDIQGSNVFYSADCALGTSDSEQFRAVIYPNPVQNILTIESKESILSIEIYSMLGKLLASEKGVSHIDFSTYTKGIYFLKIDTEKGAVFQKVVKE
jgi:Leucine-rich repeat (LRR) protein